PHPITVAAFSPDGTRIIIAAADKSLDERAAQLWDANAGCLIGPPLPHRDGILSACFSPNSQLVVTTGEDHVAIVWDARSGKQVTPGLQHRDKVYSACFAKSHPWLVTA